MTTVEFLEKYMKEDVLEIYDVIYDFFSKKLPKEFVENYDVGEVIVETRGRHEEVKEFDKILKFIELLQHKQPKLYQENFEYLDDFLIDIYCFRDESSKVGIAFSNFIKNPIQGIDEYLMCFKKLLFYGYTGILNKAILQNYELISNSGELEGGSGYDLALCKFYMILEEVFQKNSDDVFFSKDDFLEKLKGFDFELNEEFLQTLETMIVNPVPEENIANIFTHDRRNFLGILEIYFLKYMSKRKFSFALSGRLWGKLLEFWRLSNNNKQGELNEYFLIQTKKFEKYLSKLLAGIFLDNRSEMIAVLWGSVYVYDFLRSIDIIDQTTFDRFIEVSRVLKGRVIAQNTSSLWNFNFVHHWEKPDCISSIEFNEEEKIFKKSLLFKNLIFTSLRSEISEELNNIGELSEFIVRGSKSKSKRKKSSVNLSEAFMDLLDSDNDLSIINEPIKANKKVGRNEPCPCGSGKKYKKCCGKL